MFQVGDILTGTVKSIQKFGCFIDLGDDKVGLCHISEISHKFITNISEHLKIGQEVNVKIIEITDEKISLSIKQTLPKKENKNMLFFDKDSFDSNFEEKMAKFIKESNEKIQSINQRTSRKRRSSKSKK